MFLFQKSRQSISYFLIRKLSGRVHELLINSEKASTAPVFEGNVERFLCLWFSITHTHDQLSVEFEKSTNVLSLINVVKLGWVENLNKNKSNVNKYSIVYKPNRNSTLGLSIWEEMYLELVQSRELITRLLIRDVTSRYKQSLFGVLWTFIMPVFAVGTFVYLNYSGVLNIGETKIPYPAYALLGMTLWQLFATGITGCTGSLAGAGNLITKINFAKESLVISALAQTVFDFLIRIVLVTGVFVIYGIIPSWTTIFLPIALIPLLLLTLGFGFSLSILNSAFRDVNQIISFSVTFLLFITPVLYPAPTSEPMATLNKFNPIAALIIGARDLVIEGGFTQPNEFMYATIFSLIIFLFSWRMFHMTETKIAERV